SRISTTPVSSSRPARARTVWTAATLSGSRGCTLLRGVGGVGLAPPVRLEAPQRLQRGAVVAPEADGAVVHVGQRRRLAVRHLVHELRETALLEPPARLPGLPDGEHHHAEAVAAQRAEEV